MTGRSAFGDYGSQQLCCCGGECTEIVNSSHAIFNNSWVNVSINSSNRSNTSSNGSMGTFQRVNLCPGVCGSATPQCAKVLDTVPKPVLSYNNGTAVKTRTVFQNGSLAPYFLLIRSFENSGTTIYCSNLLFSMSCVAAGVYRTRFYGFLDQSCGNDSAFIHYSTTGNWSDDGKIFDDGHTKIVYSAEDLAGAESHKAWTQGLKNDTWSASKLAQKEMENAQK